MTHVYSILKCFRDITKYSIERDSMLSRLIERYFEVVLYDAVTVQKSNSWKN